MPIQFTCPYCRRQTLVDDQYAGQSGPCAQCGQVIAVPTANYEALAPSQPKSVWGRVFIIVVVIAAVVTLCGGMYYLAYQGSIGSREAARRMSCGNNLKQLALAAQSYHDMDGCFPAPVIEHEDGSLGRSWRVAVLPYVELAYLYDEFHFDEPWDSEYNLSVAEQLDPHVFRCPSTPPRYKMIKGHRIACSNYVMLTGPGTVGDTTGEPVTLADVRDGTSNTIIFVEVRGENAPAWCEPVDLDIEDALRGTNIDGVACIGSYHSGGCNVAFCDGSVHFLSETIDPETLRRLVERNDGKPVGEF